MTATATAATTTRSACAHLAQLIKLTKADIKAEEAQLKTKKARLQELQHHTPPDPKGIDMLKAGIARLEHELVDDGGTLAALEDEFRMRCGA